MDLMAIRNHLHSARVALGAEHPLTSRIHRVERALTPGDSLFRNDAVSAENDLLAISTELEQLPLVEPLRPLLGTAEHARAATLPDVNAAIKEIAATIELL